MSWAIVALVIFLLLVVTGLYVAGEFAAVSARRSRLAQMAENGDATAGWVLGVLEQPSQLDAFVAACQLGITLASLILGFYGQANILALLAPWLETLDSAGRAAVESLLAIGILLGLTSLQVLFGELIPKNIALQYPERTAILTALPMRWSMLLYHPLIWLFNGSSTILLKLMGSQPAGEHAHIHSPEEIVILVEESRAGGVLEKEETRLLLNTLELRNETARKVMLPRNRMLAADADLPCADLLALLATSPFSRLPLYAGDVDHIVGFVHIRDLLRLTHLRRQRPTVSLDDATALIDDAPALETLAEQGLQLEQVAALMRSITPDRAEALALRFYAGLSVRETAETMGKSEAAVKMLVYRAVRELRERLAPQEEQS